MSLGQLIARCCLALAALVAAIALMPASAAAQSCSLSITPLAFGSIDVTANAQVDASATAAVSCTGLATSTVGVCLELGPGSGGATGAADRFIVNGASQLRYGLFKNAPGGTPWGSDAWAGGGATPLGFNIVLSAGGTGSRSLPIFGRVYSGQPTAAPLAYASSFTGADARIRYGLLSFLLGCNLLTVIQTASFAVTANVPSTCRVTANTLDFGTIGILGSQRDASTTLAPTCTNGTAYQIGLDGGLSGATNPIVRRMTKGSEAVTYGLYRNAGRTQPFGNTLGVDTLSGTGSGLSQPTAVYGRVPAQATPSPGLYSDTIVATVTY